MKEEDAAGKGVEEGVKRCRKRRSRRIEVKSRERERRWRKMKISAVLSWEISSLKMQL